MRQASRAGAAEDAALHDVLVATGRLLERLVPARSPADRAGHVATFDAAVSAVHERLVRDYAVDRGEADRLVARALKATATLL